LANWEEDETFGLFLPDKKDGDDRHRFFETREEMKNWVKTKQAEGFTPAVLGLRWWGACGSDMSQLVAVDRPDLDDESLVGAIFTAAKVPLEDLQKILYGELNLLNAWLGGCVYGYVMEAWHTLTPEQYDELVELFIGKHVESGKINYDPPSYEEVAAVLNTNAWIMQACDWGYYHNLDPQNGDRVMFRNMLEDVAATTEDMKNIFEQMVEA